MNHLMETSLEQTPMTHEINQIPEQTRFNQLRRVGVAVLGAAAFVGAAAPASQAEDVKAMFARTVETLPPEDGSTTQPKQKLDGAEWPAEFPGDNRGLQTEVTAWDRCYNGARNNYDLDKIKLAKKDPSKAKVVVDLARMAGCENYVDDKLIGIKLLTKAKGEKKWREGPELKGSDLNTGGSTPNVVKLGRKVSKSKPMKVKARFTVEATNLTEDVAGTPVGTRLVESSVEEGSAIKLSRK